MMIMYEGADILPYVTLKKCVYDAREEGRVPQLVMEFSDGEGIVDAWNPQCGDCVAVAEDGAPVTGNMYVRECEPKTGGYVVRADALPKPDVRDTNLWRDTTFYVVAAQIAKKLGCKVEVSGAQDMALAYVRQNDEPALPLLARLCVFAGCTFDVFSGVVYLCNRSWMGSQPVVGELEVPERSDYSYRRGPTFTACRMEQSGISGYRKSIAAVSGSAGREFSIAVDDSIGFPGSRELKRACDGVLECVNARAQGGYVKSNSLVPFTPGSVCNVKCAQSPSLTGKAIVTRVRNDFASSRSKTWWRML